MEEGVFKFKKFKVHHLHSSMKVGVDAILLGAWAGETAHSILDVGTGCGVIALMLAQRFPEAKVLAIDIDAPSIEEADKNFTESPWKERLVAEEESFQEIEKQNQFDLIVSNPPYFASGLNNLATPREKARHQDTLSVFKLLKGSGDFLVPGGRLSVIFPIEYYDEAIRTGKENNLNLIRECIIRDKAEKKAKRVMGEFSNQEKPLVSENLILFEEGRVPTENYRKLCGEFYLKF